MGAVFFGLSFESPFGRLPVSDESSCSINFPRPNWVDALLPPELAEDSYLFSSWRAVVWPSGCGRHRDHEIDPLGKARGTSPV
ncbi:hypothetical protein Tco_1073756 [Tanacetum coccineum]